MPFLCSVLDMSTHQTVINPGGLELCMHFWWKISQEKFELMINWLNSLEEKTKFFNTHCMIILEKKLRLGRKSL